MNKTATEQTAAARVAATDLDIAKAHGFATRAEYEQWLADGLAPEWPEADPDAIDPRPRFK